MTEAKKAAPVKTKAVEAVPEYISNPFKLGFESLSRFFDTNLAWAVTLIIFNTLSFFQRFTPAPSNSGSTPSPSTFNPDSATIVALVIVITVFVLALIAVTAIFTTYFTGFFSYVALQSEKGIKVSFSEAMHAVNKRFFRLLKAGLLAFVKIIGWGMLGIIPGIVAAYRYALLGYVIMDEPEGGTAREAHARTKQLVKHRLIEVFGMGTVASLIPFVGPAIGMSGNAALYRQLQVYTDKNLEKPAKHWLNYIGFILMAALVLLIAVVGLFLIIAFATK